jgi:hypothetical protein
MIILEEKMLLDFQEQGEIHMINYKIDYHGELMNKD